MNFPAVTENEIIIRNHNTIEVVVGPDFGSFPFPSAEVCQKVWKCIPRRCKEEVPLEMFAYLSLVLQYRAYVPYEFFESLPCRPWPIAWDEAHKICLAFCNGDVDSLCPGLSGVPSKFVHWYGVFQSLEEESAFVKAVDTTDYHYMGAYVFPVSEDWFFSELERLHVETF